MSLWSWLLLVQGILYIPVPLHVRQSGHLLQQFSSNNNSVQTIPACSIVFTYNRMLPWHVGQVTIVIPSLSAGQNCRLLLVVACAMLVVWVIAFTLGLRCAVIVKQCFPSLSGEGWGTLYLYNNYRPFRLPFATHRRVVALCWLSSFAYLWVVIRLSL